MSSTLFVNGEAINFNDRTRYYANKDDRVRTPITMVTCTDTNGKNIALLMRTVEDLVTVVNEQQRIIENLKCKN